MPKYNPNNDASTHSSTQKARVVATLACRATSSRLYAKPLQLVGNRPILKHLIDRLSKVQRLDAIVLAISEGNENLAFVDRAREWNIPYVIGDQNDVLGRLIQAAHFREANIVLRVTTENPFVYQTNLDELIEHHLDTNADLTVCELLPDGAYTEVVNLAALEKAHRNGGDRHKEHCTLYIYENPDMFKIERVQTYGALARPDIRLTIDTPEDLIVARTVYTALEPEFGPMPPLFEIIKYLDAHQEVLKINSHLRATSTRLWR